jgi:hypothetical protein
VTERDQWWCTVVVVDPRDSADAEERCCGGTIGKLIEG